MDEQPEPTRLIELKSTSGDVLTVTRAVAAQSGLLHSMCGSDTAASHHGGGGGSEGGSEGSGSSAGWSLETPLTTKQLRACLDFMAHHAFKRLPEIERPLKSVELRDLVPEWDAAFVGDMELEELYQLILAADFLDIKCLLDLACSKVATFLKGKTTIELRKVLNIRSDYTAAEEAAVREENKCVPSLAPCPPPPPSRAPRLTRPPRLPPPPTAQVVRGGALGRAPRGVAVPCAALLRARDDIALPTSATA
jgi:S-phase kinase-associated protein 1